MMQNRRNFNIPSINQLEQGLLVGSSIQDMKSPVNVSQDVQKVLTADQVRHDVSAFARALIKVYGGWSFLSELEQRRILVGLKRIYDTAQGNMTATDLFKQLQPIIEKFRDYHIGIYLGGLRAQTVLGRKEMLRVGKNIASRQEGIKLEMRGNVAVFGIESCYEPAFFQKYMNQAMDMLFKSDALIIDLRGNLGGDSRVGSWLAEKLCGTSMPGAKRVFTRANLDSDTFRISANKLFGMQRGAKTDPALVVDNTQKIAQIDKFLSDKSQVEQFLKEYGYDKPIYILTDGFTMSSAEMFLFQIRKHPKVKIVGANTRGGEVYGNVAHYMLPDSRIRFDFGTDYRELEIENFELNGFIPDIKCQDGQDAMQVAMNDIKSQNLLCVSAIKKYNYDNS